MLCKLETPQLGWLEYSGDQARIEIMSFWAALSPARTNQREIARLFSVSARAFPKGLPDRRAENSQELYKLKVLFPVRTKTAKSCINKKFCFQLELVCW